MKSVHILDCDFDAVSVADTAGWARDWIHSGQRGYICTVNVAILMMMRSDPKLKGFVDRASLVVADGQPLVWASHLQPDHLPERVTGIDLIDELCALAAAEGFGVYFLGARRSVIEAAAQRLAERHQGLEVCGVADGYFGASEASQRAQAIRDSGAKILIVGMGVPRQEEFIENHWDQLGVQLAIPVGGSFDVIAGTARRAPVLLQRMGLEWSFRLAQEPRRLWKRYLVTNTQFMFHLLKSAVGSKLRPRQSLRGDQDADEDKNPVRHGNTTRSHQAGSGGHQRAQPPR